MSDSKKRWQRARRPEQKEERRAAILEASAKLLDAEGIEGTGLNAIGRATGMSKPNLYRYFESREAILLQLLLDAHRAWARAFESELETLTASADAEAVAHGYAKSIAGRKNYCVLIGALATVLEHNVSADTVREFKRQLQEQNRGVVARLQEALPALNEEACHGAIVMLVMASSGMWPHCHPAPVVEEVLREPEFAPLKFDFEAMVREHATLLIRGLLA